MGIAEIEAGPAFQYWWALLTLGFRLVAGLLLGIAAIGKLAGHDDLAATFEAAVPLPEEARRWMLRVVPWVEAATSAFLLLGLQLRLAGLASVMLFGAFTYVSVVHVVRGDVSEGCGCFGDLIPSDLAWPEALRNILLALGSGVLIWGASPYLSVDLMLRLDPSPSPQLPPIIDAIGVVLVAGLLMPLVVLPSTVLSALKWGLMRPLKY